MTSHRSVRSILALLFAFVLVLSACGSSDEAATDTSAAAAAEQVTDAPADDTAADDTAADDTATDDSTADDSTADDSAADDSAADAATATPAGDTKRTRLGDKLTVTAQSIESGRFEALVSVEGDPEFPDGVEFTMEGAFSGDNSEVTLDFGTLVAAAMAAEGGSDLGPFAELFEEPLIVRTVGNKAYISWPILSMFTGGQGTWVETDVDDASSVTDSFGGAGTGSPSDFIASLEDANAEITELDTEEIRGVETTHFRALVDLAELSASMSAEEQASLEDDFGDIDTSEFPIEFWVDGDGLLRRYSMEIAEDAGGSASFVFDLFDYGADISIEAPPADEIIPADQLDLDSLGF